MAGTVEQSDGAHVGCNDIVMRFSGDMWDVRPRRLWQQLFDFYRSNGCPLGHMDNMMIDTPIYKRALSVLSLAKDIEAKESQKQNALAKYANA